MSLDISAALFKYAVYVPVVTLRGERVLHHVRSLEESQWFPPDRLRAIQEEKLERLLLYSRAHVPLYRERFNKAVELHASPLEAFGSLPFVTKLDLIHANASLRSEQYRGPLTIKTTGGSTGQAVTVRKSRHATALEAAANWRGFRWEGIDIGDRQARFWGVPVTRSGQLRAAVIDWLAHRRRYSAFRFAPEDIARYLEDLGRFRPHYVYGYASMLRCVAEYLVQTNRPFPSDLRAVVSTSEPLTSPDRRLFERAFNAPIFNEYGCGELGTIAHECEKGQLHVHAENLLVEILAGDAAAQPGEAGEVVVTELNNTAMPLIRYRLGDFAAFSQAPCPCGRTLPVLTSVFGRSYDMVGNRLGQKLHGEFFMYIFEDARIQGLGVDAFQVIQHDYEHVTVKVVPNPAFGKTSEAFITERIRAGLGGDVQVSFERVEEIAREKSGKLRLVIGMSPTRSSS